MAGGLKKITRTDSFARDYKKLDPNMQKEVDEAIRDLLRDPIPQVRRMHPIDNGRPKVFSIDVTSNKSHKISFSIDGEECLLRRVGTHKLIDRNN